MHTLAHYSNRDIDAQLMHARLVWGRKVTTAQAQERLARLIPERAELIRNYKDTRTIDNEIGTLQLLLQDRERWASYCCDDCAHWAGDL